MGDRRVLSLLKKGEVVACQALWRGSNEVFLLTLAASEGAPVRAVYKPQAGEAPLWDFPLGTLYQREYLAYRMAEALGWSFVPPTVIREGPQGVGVVQLLVDHEPQHNYFSLRGPHGEEFRRICLFDWLANNADRKAGHCLLGRDGRIWAIDHGLTFHAAPKLRTVIWEFAGEAIPPHLLGDVERLLGGLERRKRWAAEMERLLSTAEVEALRGRLRMALARGHFPLRSEGGVPWPMV